MELKKEEACQALIDGKLVIAYFGKNGDYKYNHLAAPVEIRLIGNSFCTYTSQGEHARTLKDENIAKALIKKFDDLEIHSIHIIDKRPINEPLII